MIQITTADLSDSTDCTEIAQAVALSNTSDLADGFLVDTFNEVRFAYYLNHGIVRVARYDTRIVGFLIAYPKGSEPYRELEQYLRVAQWTDDTILRSEHVFYVHHKATAPDFRRRGVARALYESVLAEFPDAWFFGATVEKPILNPASQAVRQTLGFSRVGIYSAETFMHFRDYQSGLYMISQATLQPPSAKA